MDRAPDRIYSNRADPIWFWVVFDSV